MKSQIKNKKVYGITNTNIMNLFLSKNCMGWLFQMGGGLLIRSCQGVARVLWKDLYNLKVNS